MNKAVKLDYRQSNAADSLLPEPSVLSSVGWKNLHLEVFQQPKFEIAEHQHTMHVIAYAPISANFPRDSTGQRWLDGKLYHETRQQGAIAIIPAEISHRCNWNTSVEFMVLAIEPALLQQLGEDLIAGARIELLPQCMNISDTLIQGIFSALKAELELSKLGGNLLIDSLQTTLAIHLLRNYCVSKPKFSTYSHGLSPATLQQVKQYIHEHLHHNLQLGELSAIAQLSPYYFLRLFKQCMGITPHQYILQCRLEKAKYLLKNSELNIAEIAVQTGFSDQSHLTKCCKRRFGVTPKQILQG
ncbi:AraC family transcriptional regulator [Nostoc sp. FACHB-110]|uniref:helix-turn-helix domain-containing protein n=1 Tax=Nostoc sp. FACHB-110 TaxID=2692834 RepID=UPI0018EF857D|nr:AraC family transcriptional regulator [Nostoc sp. FACHB-110]